MASCCFECDRSGFLHAESELEIERLTRSPEIAIGIEANADWLNFLLRRTSWVIIWEAQSLMLSGIFRVM